MCSPAPCYSCGKTTWAGCGMHAEMVMASLPTEARCSCSDEEQTETSQPGAAFGW